MSARGWGQATHRAEIALLQALKRLTTETCRSWVPGRTQANRKAYAEDSQTIIRRQRAAIEKLQIDNAFMKRELDVAAVVRQTSVDHSLAASDDSHFSCDAHRRTLGALTSVCSKRFCTCVTQRCCSRTRCVARLGYHKLGSHRVAETWACLTLTRIHSRLKRRRSA